MAHSSSLPVRAWVVQPLRGSARSSSCQPRPPATLMLTSRPQRLSTGGGGVSARAVGTEGDGISDIRKTSISKLQSALEAAVAQEDYEVAASLRDKMQELESVSLLAVEEANAAFYRAFETCDFQAMCKVWGQGDHVQCVHPMAGCIAGRDEVIESWKLVLSGVDFEILLKNVRVHVSDGMAFVTCTEVMEGDDNRGRLIATNLFELQEGEWKMVQHHASPAPRGV